jgi:DNA invertase Pin-like site-specific DNA recombinase
MTKSPPRRAFSYIRFSSAVQAAGGSLDRQAAMSRTYCQRKGLTLDDSLTLQDLGVSAFRGDNVREGALAGFLEACRLGRVPKGSVLVVESLDRLSRDQIRPALQLFLALQDFGITIVTLQPEREYPPDATDALALIEPLIVFARAHEESAMKSHRRRDGWKRAREKARQGGGPMMNTCPAWLDVTEDGFRVKEEAAAAVRCIYALARDGWGVHRIVQKLTKDEIPPIGAGSRWVKAYVYRILTNPAAMGTYQPMRQDGKRVVPDGEPIPNFYPAVVSEEEWRQARAALDARAGEFDERGRFRKGGRSSPAAGRRSEQEVNLFSGLVRDALTGGKLHIVYSLGRLDEAGKRKLYTYLCPSQETGINAGGHRIDYNSFEAAVLTTLRELPPSEFMAEKGSIACREAEMLRLSGRLLDIDTRLERAKQRAQAADDFDAFLDLIQRLQGERRQVSQKIAELREEEERQQSADLGAAHSLIDLLSKTPAEKKPELRQRLKARIRQFIASMWVVTVPKGRNRLIALQIWFNDGMRCRDYLILHKPPSRRKQNQSSAKRHGEASQSSTWAARSLARTAAADKLDLRTPRHARRLAKALAGMDPATDFGDDGAGE